MILYLAVYTIIVSFAMAINNYKIYKNTLLLAALFFIFATYSLTHYFTVYSQDPFYIAIFYSHFTALWFLPGPLLYFYVRNTLTDEQKLKPTDLFLVHMVNMTPYFLSPFSYKLHVAQLIIQDFNNLKHFGGGFLYGTIVATLTRPSLIIGYCIYCAYSIFQYNPQRLLIKQNRHVLAWLIILISTIFIVVVSYLSLTIYMATSTISRLDFISYPAHMIAGVAFFILPTTMLAFFPKVLYGMPSMLNPEIKTPQKRKKEDGHDPFEEIAQKIEKYILKEKPFLNPEFDVIDISKALNIPKHHVIYCFSVILGIKFTSYRSKQRVEYAKKLLESGKANSLSIDGIGQQAGFPSRSTYYATFKTETGFTPNQYLEEVGVKSEE
jgi:AraC-like DNA-binding protein